MNSAWKINSPLLARLLLNFGAEKSKASVERIDKDRKSIRSTPFAIRWRDFSFS